MATVKFYLNHPYLKGTKTLRKDEVAIDMMCYIDKNNRFPLSTGERIQPKYWNKEAQQAKPNYTGHVELNLHLSRIKQDALQAWRDHKNDDISRLKAVIRAIVKGDSPTVEKKTFIEAVQRFIAQYEQEKEKTTAGRYKALLNKLAAFNPDLTFQDINQTFYDNFKRWLYSNHNPVYSGYDKIYDSDLGCYVLVRSDNPANPVGLFDDIVFKYLVNIQTILRWAEKREYEVNPSFKSWEIIKREYPVISLTLEELQRIEGLSNLPRHLEITRDYLSVACRTGQRISDVKRISALSISSGTWTIYQKKGSRQKQKVVQLPLKGFCAPVKDIIDKYGGKLPEQSEQKINEHIKTICEMAGITQEIFIERWQGNKKIRIPGKKYEFISTHSGKKTFITILGNMGVPVKIISDLTGTGIRTIEKHYLGKTDLYIVDSYLEKIETKTTLRKAN